VAEPRRNGRIGKVLELADPRFHAAIAAVWNAIAVLERFCRFATETEIATETAFWILGHTQPITNLGQLKPSPTRPITQALNESSANQECKMTEDVDVGGPNEDA